MQFTIPLKYADLTLGQLVTIQTEPDKLKRVAACANIKLEDLRAAPLNDVNEADKHLRLISEEETGKHLRVITLEGKEYGFIPNWQEFTLGEWIDIEDYSDDFWNNSAKIMSILYRPILRRQGESYTIEKYTAKEDSEVFNQLPADLFGGCIIFFLTSKRKLQSIILSSLTQMGESLINSLENGDGIPAYTPSRAKIILNWMRLRLNRWGAYLRTSHSSRTSTIN